MGNTILAHVFYCCDRFDIDLSTLFSSTADAHAVQQYKSNELIASHTLEHPSKLPILVTVTCRGWDEVIRKKMSYAKWYKQYPQDTNFAYFGMTQPDLISQYPLENLTIKYYDTFVNPPTVSAPELALGDYLIGSLDALKNQISETLGWIWNDTRSQVFHAHMLHHNRCYLDWLEHIKEITAACLSDRFVTTDLAFWERAVILAKICYDINIDPAELRWQEYDADYLSNDNRSLLWTLDRLKK